MAWSLVMGIGGTSLLKGELHTGASKLHAARKGVHGLNKSWSPR
jgi:hypothetical protein